MQNIGTNAPNPDLRRSLYDMKLIMTILVGCLALLSSGCRTESADPIAKQIIPHLAQLRDTPTQEQMFKVIGECEKLREAHGHESVATALKQIARQNLDLQEQALSLLSRYVSAEQYGNFVQEIKTKK